MSAVAILKEEEIRLGRQVRESWVRDLKQDLEVAGMVVVARLAGVPAREINRLRQSLEAYDGSFHVVKNSLCRIVFRDLSREGLESMLRATCGVGSIRGDAAAACKLLVQFSKQHEGFVLQGAWMSGSILRAQELVSLATLPPRPVLIAQVIGGMRAPIAGLVRTLQGVHRHLVGVIHAILRKKEGA